MKNSKTKSILTAVGYLLVVFALCFSVGIGFHAIYYESIYVSGISMSPTLTGADDTLGDQSGKVVDFGIVDHHKSAIKNIKRFDIVTTYYPLNDYNADGSLSKTCKKKIKRVIGMPGDTFKIEGGLLYTKENDEYTLVPQPFLDGIEKTNAKDTAGDITLGEDEYWVLGDNRENSHDSGSAPNQKIKTENIYGVLVAIEGTGVLYVKDYKCPSCGDVTTSYGTGLCEKCNKALEREYDIKSKHYHWPKYY